MTPKPTYDELYQKVKALESKIVLARHSLTHSNDEIHTRLDHPEAFADIITADKKMVSIFKYVEHIASTLQPLLISYYYIEKKIALCETLIKIIIFRI